MEEVLRNDRMVSSVGNRQVLAAVTASCLGWALDLFDLFVCCLRGQVKVIAIQRVDKPLAIHFEPERNSRVKSDGRVRQIGKFQKDGALKYFF